MIKIQGSTLEVRGGYSRRGRYDLRTLRLVYIVNHSNLSWSFPLTREDDPALGIALSIIQNGADGIADQRKITITTQTFVIIQFQGDFLR